MTAVVGQPLFSAVDGYPPHNLDAPAFWTTPAFLHCNLKNVAGFDKRRPLSVVILNNDIVSRRPMRAQARLGCCGPAPTRSSLSLRSPASHTSRAALALSEWLILCPEDNKRFHARAAARRGRRLQVQHHHPHQQDATRRGQRRHQLRRAERGATRRLPARGGAWRSTSRRH